jgi:hypothetical protein
MSDIFISYRRDDSAGHAGRLFDRLQDELGAAHVFMDVTDLRPGQDFAVELERAVARADCLLAVIGPRWLAAVDAAGRRRIDDADDFVRREIGAALAQGATVIPVLVHGATMPRAEELPEALRSLARRQAINLTDQRWDRDVQELVQLLSAGGQATTPPRAAVPVAAPLAPRPRHRVGAIALLLAVMAAVAVGASWRVWDAAKRTATTAEQAPHETARSAAGDAPAPGQTGAAPSLKPAGPAPSFAIALPPLSEVRFRTNRAQVVFTLLAIRQEPRDSATQVLTVLVRMLNRGPSDEAFGSDQFRLIAGDQAIAPTSTLISSVEATEAKEASLRFVAPSGAADVALEVRMNAESTRMPISLAARSPIRDDPTLDAFGHPTPARVVDTLKDFPASLPAGQQVDVGGASFRLSAAVIERETAEKASLTLTVRCSVPRGANSVNFWSSSVRLWVDGVPRAPVNYVNLGVGAGDSKEDRFVFDLVSMPQVLEVGLFNGGDSVRLPLSLAGLARH